MTPNQIAFGVLAALFIVVFAAMLASYINQCKLIKNCTESLIAKVVSVDLLVSTPSSPVYYTPTVEYEVNDKIVKTVPSSNLSAKDKYAEGEEIEIMYNPNKINSCYIAGKFTTTKVSTIIIGLLTAISLVLFIGSLF